MWEEFPTKRKYLLINIIFVKKKKKTRFKLLHPCSLFIAVIFQIVATDIIAVNHKFASVGLQIYKMINLGSNVIVYKLKHCVLHFEVNMMTF